jgi:circadian clock protein KaiB
MIGAVDNDTTAAFDPALVGSELAPRDARYVLRLYVIGQATCSMLAVAATRTICETYLNERYELEVIDLYRQPFMAERDRIIVAPTLVKVLPTPLPRFIGDLSDIEQVLVGLNLKRQP